LFLLCSVFTGFSRVFTDTESGQFRDQEQGIFGVMGRIQEWGFGMSGRAVFMRRDGQMKSAQLAHQNYSGLGRKGGGRLALHQIFNKRGKSLTSWLSATDPELSAGERGECVREERLFFQTYLCDMLALLTFYLRPCPFLFRPLSVRDTFIYALCTLFSNYGINKALPPKPT